uniref:SPI-1 type 3 secretion system secretin N0 domain-containing protein n=1 Tax=uncultured Thiotrichaceae bacterium TaxID=298394 RepID=A0A6S6UJE5_9GAMM|nr:MAG: Unknown protein [uncultured Thiotrichaceae bacterium]
MLSREVLFGVLVMCACQLGNAAPLPWNDKPYSHYSDEEPLAEMLKSLSANQGTPITVSEKVQDVVSMHYKNKPSKVVFEDVAKTYGLIWYYDGEAIFVYKEEEARRGSVSMKTMSPQEFSEALERLDILDGQYHWETSEVDNVIYFTGPERFVNSVIDMAKLIDNQPKKRSKIFKWTDASGRVNFSNERPLSSRGSDKDVATEDRFPGFDVVDVIER